MVLPFKKRIKKIGNSYHIIIPSYLIKEKEINPGKDYVIIMKEYKNEVQP